MWYRDRGRVQERLLVGGWGVVQEQSKGTGELVGWWMRCGTGTEEGFGRAC